MSIVAQRQANVITHPVGPGDIKPESTKLQANGTGRQRFEERVTSPVSKRFLDKPRGGSCARHAGASILDEGGDRQGLTARYGGLNDGCGDVPAVGASHLMVTHGATFYGTTGTRPTRVGRQLRRCRNESPKTEATMTEVPDDSLIAPWGARADLETFRHSGHAKITAVPEVTDSVYDGLRACARKHVRGDKERTVTSGTLTRGIHR